MNQNFKSSLQWTFLILSVLLISMFLYFSNGLVKSLGQEETEKMALWAEAYQQLILADQNADMSMQWQVIGSNTTIPVFYTEVDGSVQGFKNIKLPFLYSFGKAVSDSDTIAYLQSMIPELTDKGNFIEINIMDDWKQYLYYDESILLQQLHYYPYVQIMAVIVLALLFYYMLLSRKRSEQNRVWVGLSKETAHQLGTPIQSLMGWVEFLRANQQTTSDVSISDNSGLDIASEMDKDVQRLRVVAERFSKIGSEPVLEKCDLREVVTSTAEYMQNRVSKSISITASVPDVPVEVYVCKPLFAWVIENLCKNAIDAQDKPKEQISIDIHYERLKQTFSFFGRKPKRAGVVIEVTDNGKGIAKNRWNTVFNPGYTTKKRGWGLGLALVKRIVEEYHHGSIFIKSSTVGLGTTFRIEL
ncbi:MAG: HAMP domain-containing histidine kinase [Bacteroidales bacterium]|nr:HAMP domain-containing histidine kinase [Candidatus Liminaster caballi]